MFTSQHLPGFSAGADDKGGPGQEGPEFGHQGDDGLDFAHGDAVEPQAGRTRRYRICRQLQAQAGPKAFSVAPGFQVPEKIRPAH